MRLQFWTITSMPPVHLADWSPMTGRADIQVFHRASGGEDNAAKAAGRFRDHRRCANGRLSPPP